MTRTAWVLRPEPGASSTLARLAAVGVAARAAPLFHVEPVAWDVPAGAFDALLLTSANAIRHGGPGLARVRHLPVVAVGEATAAAARAAGFDVVATGEADAVAAVRAAGTRRLLHLAGRDRKAVPGLVAVTVYASRMIDPPPAALSAIGDGDVVLLHSARAAARLAGSLPVRRAGVRLAALSDAVAAAAGEGWARIAIAPRPTDTALVAAAVSLAIDP